MTAGAPGQALDRGVTAGINAFRWAALAWMTAVLFLSRDDLVRPWGAWSLVAVAAAVTLWAQVGHRGRARAQRVVELVTAVLLLVGDGWVYGPEHGFSASQSLGSAWPLASVLGVGATFGSSGGALAGVVLGVGRLLGTLINQDLAFAEWSRGQYLSVASSTVLFALAGSIAGYAAGRLRIAEHEISAARAREEVARELHDGVLQTLAVIQRRSGDAELVRLARTQEADLRRFLDARHGDRSVPDRTEAVLHDAVSAAIHRFGSEISVVVPEPLPTLDTATAEAVGGAVGEALANSAKHAPGAPVVVYTEPAEPGSAAQLTGMRLFVSVKDRGPGFDPAHTPEGRGLAHSVRARIEESGGRVEIAGNPGAGCDVRIWMP